MLSYRRAFPVNPDSLAPGHPYVFDNSRKSCQIAFYEFRGTGPPSSDYGYPGDVYVDLTPGAHALYWRDRQGHTPGQWRRWRAVVLDKVPLHKYLVSHPWVNDPQESDLYLWVDPDGVTWTSRAEICSSRVSMVQKDIATITPGERNPDVDALVAEILAKMIEVEELRTLPPIQDKRDRYSGTSPLLPGHPAERRERSQSSASQYSPREALRRIPSTNSPPHHRNTAHHPVYFRSSPPRSRSPELIPYAPSHHDRSLPPIAPSSTHSDLRDHITAAAEPHRRQTPAEYSAYRAGPSNPRASEPSPPGPSTPNPHPGATEQELRENFAWNEMQRAQYAEAHFKRELRLKNRELSKFKKKEKDVISMSFMYQKKEQELMSALEAVQKRSTAELEEQRAALRAAQRQVEDAEEQTREAVRELRRLEEALADARREIQELKSCERNRTLSPPHESRTSYTDADRMEVENGGLKEEMNRLSFSWNEGRNRERKG